VVHVNKLKRYFGPTPKSWLETKLYPSRKEVLADANTSKDLPEASGSSDDEIDMQNDQQSREVVQSPAPGKRLRRPPGYLFAYHW